MGNERWGRLSRERVKANEAAFRQTAAASREAKERAQAARAACRHCKTPFPADAVSCPTCGAPRAVA